MNTQTRTADPLSKLLDTAAFDQQAVEGQLVIQGSGGPGAMPAQSGLITGVQGDIFTAQRVAQSRNMARIMDRLKALAHAAGKDWVYGWEVNDRKNNRKTWIEGPTIKLANDLAREYGNCMVDCRVRDEGPNWVFYGRFIDLETGYQMVRAYQQRKGQDTGMKDSQRAADMVFQIGQSKCLRNVVVNALQTLADYCVEEAKSGVLERVGKNPDAAREWIVKMLEKLSIERKRVEAIYGRSSQHWTVADMARIYTEIQSIQDGMMNAEDVYPSGQQPESKDPKEPKRSPQTSTSPSDAKGQAPSASQPGPAATDKPPLPRATASGGEGPKDGAASPRIPLGSIIHFFDANKKPLGSLPYREGMMVGATVNIDDAPVRIVELLELTDKPLEWIAEVAKVEAPSQQQSTAQQEVNRLTDMADEAGEPAAPKRRGKRGAVNFGEAA